MSALLDAEPIVLEQADVSVECGYNGCDARAMWSTFWSCGETLPYCDRHLAFILQEAQYDGVSCCCPGVDQVIHIYPVMTVPL